MPPPTPAFCKKSPQPIENKGKELQKERQEISRARKLLRRRHLEVWTESILEDDDESREAHLAKVWQEKELGGWLDTS